MGLMEFLSQLTGGGAWFLGYLIPFLIVLTIVVFFHELGHYLVARWNDVDVEAFSIGFGPEIFGFNDRRGTRWKLALIPLGGYVKFAGDANAASVPDRERLANMNEREKSGSLEQKSVGQRAAVVAAGPIANFILAILIFAGSFYFVGRYVTDPLVGEVQPGGAAQEAGFLAGDLIKSINGVEIDSFNEVPRLVGPNHDREMTFVVNRGGVEMTLKVTPRTREQTDRFGNVYRSGMIGIVNSSSESNLRVRQYSALAALGAGVGETWFIITRTLGYLGDIIIGRQSADQLGGPIRIAKVSGEIATLGAAALINLAAILSVSIGLLNLFPIPMLDGGHLVFYAIEAIRGRPLSDRSQDMAFRFGLVLVMTLMVFATWNDVNQLF